MLLFVSTSELLKSELQLEFIMSELQCVDLVKLPNLCKNWKNQKTSKKLTVQNWNKCVWRSFLRLIGNWPSKIGLVLLQFCCWNELMTAQSQWDWKDSFTARGFFSIICNRPLKDNKFINFFPILLYTFKSIWWLNCWGKCHWSAIIDLLFKKVLKRHGKSTDC